MAAWLVWTAWTLWALVDARSATGLSWHFFADGSQALLHADGLSVYARHPELQVGPLSLVVAALFSALPGGAGKPVALAAMALTGAALLALLATVVPAERRRTRILGAALALLPAWVVLGVRWGHLDDVLAMAAAVGAVVAVRRGRPVLAGLLLAAAVASKPWAVGFVPLLLALPRTRLLRATAAAAAGVATAWLPFVLGDPATLTALHPRVALVPGSGLWALGVRGDLVPGWGRLLQLLLAPVVALAFALRQRCSGVLLVAVAVRLALDPQDNAYYAGSAVLAALVFDLTGTRWRVPWAGVVTAVVLWQPFVLDYPHRLTSTTGLTHWWFAHQEVVGWMHLAWAVVAVGVVALVPRHSRTAVPTPRAAPVGSGRAEADRDGGGIARAARRARPPREG